jgi:hypothetical protein
MNAPMFALTKREQRVVVLLIAALVLGTTAKIHVDLANKPLLASAPTATILPSPSPEISPEEE